MFNELSKVLLKQHKTLAEAPYCTDDSGEGSVTLVDASGDDVIQNNGMSEQEAEGLARLRNSLPLLIQLIEGLERRPRTMEEEAIYSQLTDIFNKSVNEEVLFDDPQERDSDGCR